MECPTCNHPNVDGARFCAKCGAPLPTPTSEEDPLIGSIVGGRYRITAILGEGGMGRVYTAEQQMGTTVRKAAVKTLLAQYAKDPQVLARFNRECGTVAELEHPNTIKVYDFGQTNTGELYIAMELLVGTSLEEALEKGGAMQPERVERIIGQAAGSLQEAHDKGIVHRDLKPANIFLTKRAGEDDYVKVLDFGIAKRAERPDSKEQKLTQQGTVLGTPPYMSPEQFRGQELDNRSDIYSLAVVTYEMLTGRLPFDADTPWAWATQHLTQQPFPFEITPIGANVPPKMRAAILRGLEKDRNKRQTSVKQFFEELSMGGARMGAPMTGQQPVHGGGASMGAMPSGQMHSMQSGPMASVQGRPGATQIGEPLFAQQPMAPAGRTVIDTGTGQSAAMSMTPQPMPAMPMHQSQPPMHGHMGGMGGPGYVAPPPPPPAAGKPSSNNMLPIIGGIVVLMVVGIVGVIFAVKGKSGGGDGEVLTLPSATTPTAVVVASDPPPATSSGGSTATPNSSAGSTSGGSVGGTSTSSPATTNTTKTPTVDPKADGACDAAIQLALGGNTSLAIGQYRSCSGPKRDKALAAINSSSAREVKAKGCAAKPVALQAASIGATAGKAALPANCR
ncbi:MAG TPA: protein kinase [Polyangium sp.]|nr:protein kinase [Polyangium sp.]